MNTVYWCPGVKLKLESMMANEYDSQQSDLQNMANLVSGGLDLSKVGVEYQQYLVSQPDRKSVV